MEGNLEMCGLLACVSENPKVIEGTLSHRGPDEIYFYKNPNILIEYRRLSITGGDNGKTPVRSQDGRYLVLINGEIYNFRELQSLNFLPTTSSDMQVVADGLSQFGLEFLLKLRGMFAGIIVDTKLNKYYVVRDFMGEKPLFFAQEKNSMFISSEFQSIFRNLNRPLSLDYESIYEYFQSNFVSEPNTFDTQIKAVLPGYVYEIDVLTKSLRRVLTLNGVSDFEKNQTLENLLKDVLEQTTYSQLSVAIALSEGIDSLSLLNAILDTNVQEIYGFTVNEKRESQMNPLRLERLDHEILKIRNHVNIEDFQSLTESIDQPVADPAALSYLSIIQNAKIKNQRILYFGHGADELFWGYPWIHEMIETKIKELKTSSEVVIEFGSNPASSKRLLRLLNQTIGLERKRTFRVENESQIRNGLRNYLAEGYLRQNGFALIDRLSMRYGIEPRLPYADSRLFGWAQNYESKNYNLSKDKGEFRQLVTLNHVNVDRDKPKAGFYPGEGNWVKSKRFKELFRDLLKFEKDANLKIFKFNLPRILYSKSDRYKIMLLLNWLRFLSNDTTEFAQSKNHFLTR